MQTNAQYKVYIEYNIYISAWKRISLVQTVHWVNQSHFIIYVYESMYVKNLVQLKDTPKISIATHGFHIVYNFTKEYGILVRFFWLSVSLSLRHLVWV